MSRPVTLLIVGAGDRGTGYARLAAGMPGRARVVGVAEPRPERRARFAAEHGLAPDCVFTDWRAAADRPRFADAVIVATPDALHVAPALAFAGRGWHLMLEKPMAPTEAGCRRVHEAVTRAGVIFTVCHVLRYTAYTRAFKRLLDAGAVGDIVSVQHLEPVGFWHQAHSFVRGNWRNERESSFMLLAKSCHDMDWLRYIVGQPCARVSSFGTLHHFRAENAPAGAAARCLDCAVERACPYSAKRIYLGLLRRGVKGWPVSVVAPGATRAALLGALREGPYGRCVYACDNDVVDHQVVSLDFAGGRSAVFTMTAFASMKYGRFTRVFGTRGELTGDSRTIVHDDFRTGRRRTIDPARAGRAGAGGHGGGDGGLLEAFVAAVRTGDPSLILSGADESLESHRMVFAAERARRSGRVVTLTTGERSRR